MVCPELRCNCGICKVCYESYMERDRELIDPPTSSDVNRNSSTLILPEDNDVISHMSSLHSSNSSVDESGSDTENHITEYEDMVLPMDDDDIDDDFVIGGIDDIPNDEVIEEYSPSTLAGE